MMISTFKLCRDPGWDKASTGTIPGVFLPFYDFPSTQLGSHPEISYQGKVKTNDGGDLGIQECGNLLNSSLRARY